MTKCQGCAAEFTPKSIGRPQRFCSGGCRARYCRDQRTLGVRHADRIDLRRTDFRRAYDGSDWAGLLAVIHANSTDVDGCWLWDGSLAGNGYANFKLPSGYVTVHRVAWRAAHEGLDLGVSQAHHVCAVRRCVNPAHIVPATSVENMVEMKARSAYLARIRELEDALYVVDPANPALTSAVA